jgi:hypothetical protein
MMQLGVIGAQRLQPLHVAAVKVFDLFYKCINTELIGSLLVSDVDEKHVKDRRKLQDEAVSIGRGLRERIIK